MMKKSGNILFLNKNMKMIENSNIRKMKISGNLHKKQLSSKFKKEKK